MERSVAVWGGRMPLSSIRECTFPAFSPLPSTLPFFTSLFQTSMLPSPPCEHSLSLMPSSVAVLSSLLQSFHLSLRSLRVRQQVLVPPAKPPGLADKSIHHCNWFCRGSKCLMRAPPLPPPHLPPPPPTPLSHAGSSAGQFRGKWSGGIHVQQSAAGGWLREGWGRWRGLGEGRQV